MTRIIFQYFSGIKQLSMTLNTLLQFIGKIYNYLAENRLLWYLGLVVVCAISWRWFTLIDQYAVNILFLDQWDYYGAILLDKDSSLTDHFTRQLGPHRMGLGFIVQIFIDWFSGWNTRYTAFAIGILMLITALIYLALKEKLFDRINFFDVIIFLLVLSPVQSAVFGATPNIAHGSMPVLLLALFCLTLGIRNTYWRHGILLLINFNMVFTGFGLFVGLITPLIFFGEAVFHYKGQNRKQVMISVISFGLSLLTLYLFTVDYALMPANKTFEFPHPHPWEYVQFITAGIAYFFRVPGSGFWALLSGGLVLTTLLYILVMHIIRLFRNSFNPGNREVTISMIIVVLISFTLLFYISTAIGRVSLGVRAAQSSRYIPYLIPALIALYFHLQIVGHKYKGVLIPGMLMIVLFSFLTIKTERDMLNRLSEGKKAWKEAYLHYEDIHKADSVSSFSIHPRPEVTELDKKLKYLKDNRFNLYAE